ncbi:hypothetical protein BDV95DRAFT_612598 [Massariosphaeria phaeospora]|uniref:Uncharacterized protein n=1 Tax=Massariosphaeria phaeospora TaxID=100035 RepID=A0A7C8HYU8_9PLEO|nr:hypothetical protein BDV95DRAFT_612598 [Massariosphaeria phaeospora]
MERPFGAERQRTMSSFNPAAPTFNPRSSPLRTERNRPTQESPIGTNPPVGAGTEQSMMAAAEGLSVLSPVAIRNRQEFLFAPYTPDHITRASGSVTFGRQDEPESLRVGHQSEEHPRLGANFGVIGPVDVSTQGFARDPSQMSTQPAAGLDGTLIRRALHKSLTAGDVADMLASHSHADDNHANADLFRFTSPGRNSAPSDGSGETVVPAAPVRPQPGFPPGIPPQYQGLAELLELSEQSPPPGFPRGYQPRYKPTEELQEPSEQAPPPGFPRGYQPRYQPTDDMQELSEQAPPPGFPPGYQPRYQPTADLEEVSEQAPPPGFPSGFQPRYQATTDLQDPSEHAGLLPGFQPRYQRTTDLQDPSEHAGLLPGLQPRYQQAQKLQEPSEHVPSSGFAPGFQPRFQPTADWHGPSEFATLSPPLSESMRLLTPFQRQDVQTPAAPGFHVPHGGSGYIYQPHRPAGPQQFAPRQTLSINSQPLSRRNRHNIARKNYPSRPRRSDQGPEPSDADIYPADAPRKDSASGYAASGNTNRRQVAAQAPPRASPALRVSDRNNWPTPAEVHTTAQAAITRFEQQANQLQHPQPQPPSRSRIPLDGDYNAADAEVQSTATPPEASILTSISRALSFILTDLPLAELMTGLHPSATTGNMRCDQRPISPAQKSGSRYGLKLGINLNEPWNPPAVKPGTPFRVRPRGHDGWGGWIWAMEKGWGEEGTDGFRPVQGAKDPWARN